MLVFTDQTGAQAGAAIFLWPRAIESEDEPAKARPATAAASASFEISFFIWISLPSKFNRTVIMQNAIDLRRSPFSKVRFSETCDEPFVNNQTVSRRSQSRQLEWLQAAAAGMRFPRPSPSLTP